MRLTLLCQNSSTNTREVDYIVVNNGDDQFAILSNHLPLITAIVNMGYLKLVTNSENEYVVIDEAIMRFVDNELKVYAVNVVFHNDLKKAYEMFYQKLKTSENKLKQDNIEYQELELELRQSIMRAGVGRL